LKLTGQKAAPQLNFVLGIFGEIMAIFAIGAYYDEDVSG